MARSCTRKTSAMGPPAPAPSRCTASAGSMQSGSPLGLPLVATRGPPKARASRWCNGDAGSIAPREGLPGATPGRASVAARRRHSNTIGAAGSARARRSAASMTQKGARASASATSRAKGLAGRRLRRRSRATAAALVASTSSWKPPTPCRARIFPAARRSQQERIKAAGLPSPPAEPARGAPDPSRSASRGPHTGQAMVSAWKRRSDGSSNSRRQAGHRANGARVVWARVQGSAVAMLKRGPQSQQLMKG